MLTKRSIAFIIIRLQIIFCLFMNLFTIFEKENYVSIFFIVTFLLTFLLYMITMSKYDMKINLLVIFIIVVSFVAVLMHANSISFNYFKKLIIFISTIVYLQSSSILILTDREKNQISFLIFLFGLLFNIAYYILKIRTIYKTSDLLAMNYTNPNLLAMWLTVVIILLFVFSFRNTSKKYSIAFLINALLLIKPLIDTGARNCYLALIFFGLFVVTHLFKKKYKLSNVTIFVCIIFPILFVAIYMIFIDDIMNNNFLSFLVSEGKSLDSRFDIWKDLLNCFKNYPIFGNYDLISNGTGVSQCLNTHLDVLCSYGLIVFVMFILFLYKKAKALNKRIENKSDMFFLIAILSVLLIGNGEAALVSGGIGIYIIAFVGCSCIGKTEENL